MRLTFLAVAAGAGSVALASCGGSVVFVEDDGAGGSGTTSSVKATTSTSAPTTSGPVTQQSSATGTMSPCQLWCSDPPSCLGGRADCLSICENLYAPGCEGLADQFVSCMDQYMDDSCGFPGYDCGPEGLAWDQCVNGGQDCTNFECQEGGQNCSCYGQCFGVDLEQVCSFVGMGVECQCYGEFGQVSCFQPDLTCDLNSGCCKDAVFFDDG